MNQKLFYSSAFAGLLISLFYLYFVEDRPLKIVLPCLAIAATAVIFIGRWHKKHGGIK